MRPWLYTLTTYKILLFYADITITLPFIRAMQNPVTRPATPDQSSDSIRLLNSLHIPIDSGMFFLTPSYNYSYLKDLLQDDQQQVIDTQAPLALRCELCMKFLL